MTKILQVGLGPLGVKTVQFAAARGFKIVAAVDNNPKLVGQDVGEVCGLKKMGLSRSRKLCGNYFSHRMGAEIECDAPKNVY